MVEKSDGFSVKMRARKFDDGRYLKLWKQTERPGPSLRPRGEKSLDTYKTGRVSMRGDLWELVSHLCGAHRFFGESSGSGSV